MENPPKYDEQQSLTLLIEKKIQHKELMDKRKAKQDELEEEELVAFITNHFYNRINFEISNETGKVRKNNTKENENSICVEVDRNIVTIISSESMNNIEEETLGIFI
jgi:nitroimidazol reductase NimA-like FMN-containing flavoprotein (pyridoxamine 5'-phosphate oxidase superfamily)